MYRIFLPAEFEKSVAKLPKRDQEGIWEKIRDYAAPQLKREPHFGLNIKKLRGYRPETWRYRIGKYRLFYSIDEKEKRVVLLYMEARKDAY